MFNIQDLKKGDKVKSKIIASFSISLIITCYFFSTIPSYKLMAPTPIQYQHKILLIPLDSRPPCTNFVIDLAKIVNIEIIIPPDEILDNYKTPANQILVRQWLKDNIKNVNFAIISTDMLIHGGLMASRLSEGSENDIVDTLQLLQEIHNQYPSIDLYAFNIIPRLWVGDSEETKKYQTSILEFSKLKDIIYTFHNPIDIERQKEVEAKLPTNIKNNYLTLYAENEKLNKELINLIQKGVLKQLLIGQDDGQSFGIPNIIKRNLQHYLWQKNIAENQVIITRGTDEIALTILGSINSTLQHHQPKIFVQYNDEKASSIVMPYMPHSVATTAKEKIEIAKGIQTTSIDSADFVLYVYIGTKDNMQNRYASAQELKKLLESGYKVALVDLSENFEASETLFPVLKANHVPLNQLIAYSGWNTTSNSIGTAITQATLFTGKLHNITSEKDLATTYSNHLIFLTSRFLEDWYYLKSSHAKIDHLLKAQNIDVYNLNDSYNFANAQLQKEMLQQSRILLNDSAYTIPIKIQYNDTYFLLKVKDMKIDVNYPWPRTFEIDIKPSLSFVIAKDIS